MADTYTANYNLTLPEIGASRDSWGSKWNTNLTTIDQVLGFAAPIGMMVDFAGPNAPSGWLVADGRLISRTTYAALFAIIGTHWGAGDGSTTFALPNPNGRSAVGPGLLIDQNGNQLSLSFTQALGNLSELILRSYLPNYNLVTDTQGFHNHGGATAPGANHNHATDVQGSHSHGGATGNNNADHTHTGSTDGQGSHNHTVGAWGAVGGGAAVAPGGIATGAAIATSTDGFHAHNIATGGASNPHAHGIGVDGAHGHNITYSGNLQLGINGDGYHAHNVALGGGGAWFPLLNPILVVTKIIYAGQQAATTMVATVAPAVLDDRDELAAIREELAELRALFAPPGRRRLLQAPMRGSH